MKVLVLGSVGFIGEYVVDRLLTDGHEVVGFDRAYRFKLPREHRSFFLGDVTDPVSVTEAMAHCDSWINLAGVLGTSETIKNPMPAIHTNILGAVNVLNAATQYDIPGVMITVGNHFENNTYSITKSTAERFCDMYRRYNGTKVTTVRALNAYGPRQVPVSPWGSSQVRKLMPSLICRVLSELPAQVYSDNVHGSNIMDMIYVEDAASVLCKALYQAVELDYGLSTVVEAGTGRRTTVEEIAKIVIEKIGHGQIEILPMREGETPGSPVVATVETLKILGIDHNEFVTLEDGVARTVQYYRELLNK